MSAPSNNPMIVREPGRRPMPGVWEWLDQHSDEYVGEWVALRDGKLVGHAVRLADVVQQIGDLRQAGAFITRIV